MGGRRLSSGRLENLLENLKREIKLRPSTKLNWEAQNASNSGEYTHGAGMVGTNGSCEVFVHEVGREIVTTVEIDLTGLKKKSDISTILFFINMEITINNKDTITKISKLIKAVEEIIERNNMLNPLLGLILFLI